jgi:uncharacterized membrane protein
MTALRIFRSACTHALASPPLVLTLYGVNLLLAFPALYFSRFVLTAALGNSLAGESLLAGFDYTVWFDLLSPRNLSLGTLLQFAVPMAILGIALYTFLAGGVLDLLAREKRFSAASFFRACGTYLGRFLAIWILTTIVLLLVIALFGTFLGVVVGIVNAQSDSEQATGITIIVSLIVFSFPIFLIFMASDYARVYTVVQGGHSSWKALGRGFQFVLRNTGSTLGLHLLLLLLLGIAVALYLVLEGLVAIDRPGTIVLVFLLQQLFMVGRAAIRVAFSAGEVALYEERKPRPVIFYGWDDSPPRREP